MMILSCKFKIPGNFEAVDMDSDEAAIKKFIESAAYEFAQGNAQLISADKFADEALHEHSENGQMPEAAIFLRLILNVEDVADPEINGNTALLTQKAIELLHGDNLQITHASHHGPETHIGFTQL